MFSESRSMSTRTGVAPTWSIEFIVATNVNGVVITSAPEPIPSATSASWSPAVHELVVTTSGRADVLGEALLEELDERPLADPSAPDRLQHEPLLGLVEPRLPEQDRVLLARHVSSCPSASRPEDASSSPGRSRPSSK